MLSLLWGVGSGAAFAQTLPGGLPSSADPQRIEKRDEPEPQTTEPTAPQAGPEQMPSIKAPEQSKKIYFTLHHIEIEGAQAIDEDELAAVYKEYLHKEITLDVAWLIAEKITNYYHDKGYFLSRAYVPKQQIDKDGTLKIGVVEGYIAEIQADADLQENAIVRTWFDRLKDAKPITSDYLESVLLQLNDIPGVSVRATLEPVKSGDTAYPEGAISMVLERVPEVDRAQVSFDNYGSKYLGPYEMSAQYDTTLIPFQSTSLHLLASEPTKELKYGTIRQRIPVVPGLYAEVYGGYTFAEPGYTLTASEIKSGSLSLGTSLTYQIMRQRTENLAAKLAFETRDTKTDILSGLAPLTRDRIRVLRASLNYDTADRWKGYSQVGLTITQGLGIFEASEAHAPNLSRAEATPWFQKAEFTASRVQPINPNWSILTSAAGQIASGPVYSSEEFGYGGQAFGRAFDSSEIVGDHGIVGSVEARYYGAPNWGTMAWVPYMFYDSGAVFNNDRTQEKTQAGMSSGAGMRFDTGFGLTGDVMIAFPIAQAVSSPIYGSAGHSPRYGFSLTYGF